MTERKIIEAQLAKKESEILMLEEKLKSAKVYIRALQDVMREIDRGTSSEESDGDVVLRRGSLADGARDLILDRGSPMHIDDLLKALGKVVTRETKASLTGSLAAYVRKGEIFTRPAPSTFGLVELNHFESEEAASEPPVGFGAPAADIDDEIPF